MMEEQKKLELARNDPWEVFNFMVYFNSEPLIKEALNKDADSS